MATMQIFDAVSIRCSRLTTQKYSTSFTLGIRSLSKRFRDPIYSIYGFVRFADEIVDTFNHPDKAALLADFKQDTWKAIDQKISLNPILHSFQACVNQYGIERELIDTFLHSMEMDLSEKSYDQAGYEKYILGSAEVVGLMCLRVFCEGDDAQYQKLKTPAMRLGSAFQKINFLRDLNADYATLGRTYFPHLSMEAFDDRIKADILKDIQKDFEDGFQGILMLPKGARFGVYVAYVYYFALLNKIRNTPSTTILNERIRIPDGRKYALIVQSYIRHQLNLIG
jgi:phytoene/squalene synthetase